jgi:hypothetical protein
MNNRRDLQAPLRACLSLPFYKLASSAMAFGGALRAVCIYLPNSQRKPSIPELEKAETRDRAKLEAEVAKEPANGPRTFRRILLNDPRFFQPAPPPAAVGPLPIQGEEKKVSRLPQPGAAAVVAS